MVNHFCLINAILFINYVFIANEFRCSECDKLLPTERLLREHVRYHRLVYTCPHCPIDEQGRGRSFPNTHLLTSHISYCHSDTRPFPCTEPHCTYSAKTQTDLNKHLEVHANTLWYYCEVSQPILVPIIYSTFFKHKYFRQTVVNLPRAVRQHCRSTCVKFTKETRIRSTNVTFAANVFAFRNH